MLRKRLFGSANHVRDLSTLSFVSPLTCINPVSRSVPLQSPLSILRRILDERRNWKMRMSGESQTFYPNWPEADRLVLDYSLNSLRRLVRRLLSRRDWMKRKRLSMELRIEYGRR